jgi:hypothetical protein
MQSTPRKFLVDSVWKDRYKAKGESGDPRRGGHVALRRGLVAGVLLVVVSGTVWVMSASARVSPINDKFQAEGTVWFEGNPTYASMGSCTLKATGTMPSSGSVITASTVTFTNCKDKLSGTLGATAKGEWTFTLAWGLPATAKVGIPKEGLTVSVNDSVFGECTWINNESFAGAGKTWENGVSEKESEKEGAVLTKSESEFNETLKGQTKTLTKCSGVNTDMRLGGLSEGASKPSTALTWQDLTHPKQAILNGK